MEGNEEQYRSGARVIGPETPDQERLELAKLPPEKRAAADRPNLDLGTARKHFEGWGTLTKYRLLTGDASYIPPSEAGSGGAGMRGSPSDIADIVLVAGQVQRFLDSCREAQRDVAYHTWVVGMRETAVIRYEFKDGSGMSDWMPAPLTATERELAKQRGEQLEDHQASVNYGQAERRDETVFAPDWRQLESPALDAYASAYGIRRQTAIKREAQRLLTAYAQEMNLTI